MVGDPERELLVLGADQERRLGLAPRLEPRDQLVARSDRRHIDLVAGHAEFRRKKVATLITARVKVQYLGPARQLIGLASIRLLKLQHELVHRHLRTENPFLAGVFRMAEEVAFFGKPE